MYIQESLASKASRKEQSTDFIYFFKLLKYQFGFAHSYLFSVHVSRLNGTKCCAVTSCSWIDLYGVAVVSLIARFVSSVNTQG